VASAPPAAEWAHPVFVGLGSNCGDRVAWLGRAVSALRACAEIAVLKLSSVYETMPVGLTAQPDFLNQVLELASGLAPRELLALLLSIENQLGRVRRQRWGPRNIDLDLLAYQRVDMQSEGLVVPHAELARRRFVLVPWCEIAPDFVVPRHQLTVAELLARCEDTSRVVKLAKA